jgi:hypothetical protein
VLYLREPAIAKGETEFAEQIMSDKKRMQRAATLSAALIAVAAQAADKKPNIFFITGARPLPI